MRQRPIEQMKRKKLRNGGVRLICSKCIERIKNRSGSILLEGNKK